MASGNRLKKTVIILGAGASTPFIGTHGNRITTTTLRDALFDHATWKCVVDEFTCNYVAGTPGALINIDVAEICDLFRRVSDSIEGHFGDVNFDQILHVIEPVCLKYSGFLMDDIENLSEELLVLFNTFDFAPTYTTVDGWRYVPYLAREVICLKIQKVWSAKRNQRDYFVGLLSDWLSFLKRRSLVNTYSFNYDELFSRVAANFPEIHNGYEQGAFNGTKLWKANEVYCQIHGSVRLYSKSQDYFISNSGLQAARIRLKNCSTHVADDTFKYSERGSVGTHYNTWLITSLEKMEGFAQGPFSTIFYRLGEDIKNSDVVLAVGTSLGDVHVNAYIYNILTTLGKTLIIVTHSGVEEFLANLHPLMLNPHNDLLQLIVRANAPLLSFGRTPDEGLENFKKRVLLESRGRGFARLGKRFYIFPSGSYQFFRDPNIFKKIMAAIQIENT